MAVLRAKARKALPASAFAYPKARKYPIHDKKHARAALSLSARKTTYGSYGHVAKAVKRRYGNTIAVKGTKRKR